MIDEINTRISVKAFTFIYREWIRSIDRLSEANVSKSLFSFVQCQQPFNVIRILLREKFLISSFKYTGVLCISETF